MFSDSGTFILIAFALDFGPSTPHVIHQLDTDPVTTRYFPLTQPFDRRNYLTPSGGFRIEPEVTSNSNRLVSTKVAKSDLLEESSDFTGQDQDEESVYLDNVVYYPSSLAISDQFLLGQNDDEKMRLMIAPRQRLTVEIRPLSLTFQ